MAAQTQGVPGLATLVSRVVRTGIGALQNRFELLTLEWQEERARLTDLLVWLVGLLFLAMMGALLLTATIIFLFPEGLRVYVAGGFTVLYFAGAFGAWMAVRSIIRREPFSESVEQTRRDQAWLKSFE